MSNINYTRTEPNLKYLKKNRKVNDDNIIK